MNNKLTKQIVQTELDRANLIAFSDPRSDQMSAGQQLSHAQASVVY